MAWPSTLTRQGFALDIPAGYGSQNSGVRSPNSRRIGVEQTADFFQRTCEIAGVAVSKILRQDQVVATLLQGSLGHIHIARFVSFPTSTKSFSNVGRDRDRRPSHLQRQAVSFLLRKSHRERVPRQHQLVRFAPHQKVLKSSRRSSGGRHKTERRSLGYAPGI